MGLDFLRTKAEQFTQRRDKARNEELDIATLLSEGMPDRIVHVFHGIRTNDHAEIIPGLGLILKVEPDSKRLLLTKHGVTVGVVESDECDDLLALMLLNNHLGGLLSVTILEPPGWDGVFGFKPTKPFTHYGCNPSKS